MTTVAPLPMHNAITDAVAGEVRAELGRARIRVSHLPQLLGNSYSYWYRRISGETALDVEDLYQLAGLLRSTPARLLGEFADASGPDGPDGGGEWAPRGSNPQPTDYKVAHSGRVLDIRDGRRRLAEVTPLPVLTPARAA